MARNKNNILVRGFKGKVGNQFVLRNRGGQTYLANVPEKFVDRVPTARQLEVQEKFIEAASYGRKVLLDPVLKAEYAAGARPEQSAYNIALQDYFGAPVLSKLVTDEYKGLVGDKMKVRARDNFKVTGVVFMILAPNGDVIEQGSAVVDDNSLDWNYTATQANPDLVGRFLLVESHRICMQVLNL